MGREMDSAQLRVFLFFLMALTLSSYGSDNHDIVDVYDSDQDNDSIHNFLDSHPYDPLEGRSDRDGDGIPDFVDFDLNPRFSHLANKQSDYFSRYSIVVISESPWSAADIQIIFDTIFSHEDLFLSLKSLTIVRLSGINKLRTSEYNSEWKTVSLFPEKLAGQSREIKTSFIHEIFHIVAKDDPLFYENFVELSPWSISYDQYGVLQYSYDKEGTSHYLSSAALKYDYVKNIELLAIDTLPSHHSLRGPEEHFADACLAAFLEMIDEQTRASFSMRRFGNLERFYQTKIYDLIISKLSTVQS